MRKVSRRGAVGTGAALASRFARRRRHEILVAVIRPARLGDRGAVLQRGAGCHVTLGVGRRLFVCCW